MNSENTQVIFENAEKLLDEIEVLLEEQIALCRAGDIDGVWRLSEQSGLMVRQIADEDVFRKPQFEQRRRRFEKLYNDLLLVLADHRAEMGENLKKARQVRKILGIYRGSV